MIPLKRERYLSRIRPFYDDAETVKVLTGMRRCGKSVILEQIIDELVEAGVPIRNILYIDLDLPMNLRIRDAEALMDAVDSGFAGVSGQRYLLVDEIQEVDGFEPVINAYRNDGVSVFITGSNSYLLSGELVTKLTGRYIEFRILPFSFREAEEWRELNGMPVDFRSDLDDYLVYGGLPRRFYYQDDSSRERYVNAVLEEMKEKDVLNRRNVHNRHLLDALIRFLSSVPGAEISSTSISKYMMSEGIRVDPPTIQRYLGMIFASNMALKCERYDVVGKRSLKTLYKAYISDMALHTFFTGRKERLDHGPLLENLVYCELVSRGYSVMVGKKGPYEIDFVVSDGRRKAYVQVAYMLPDDSVIEREIRPLLSMKDAYPKFLITMDPLHMDLEGVRVLDAVTDFLMDEEPLFRYA